MEAKVDVIVAVVVIGLVSICVALGGLIHLARNFALSFLDDIKLKKSKPT